MKIIFVLFCIVMKKDLFKPVGKYIHQSLATVGKEKG
jgi:hypothetical protein